MKMGGVEFDQYDSASFFYGWARGLQPNPFADEAVVNQCFLMLHDTIT